MKTSFWVALAIFFSFAQTSFAQAQQQQRPKDLILRYNSPAHFWEEAIPMGNGRLGAMISGTVAQDTLFLNEDTFWSGSPYQNANESCQGQLKAMRNALMQGSDAGYIEAQKLATKYVIADTEKSSQGQSYAGIGRLLLSFPGHNDAKNYRRFLNLEKAISQVAYTIGDVDYRRETFCSFADQVVIVRLEASKKGKLQFQASWLGVENTDRSVSATTAFDKQTLEVRTSAAQPAFENIPNSLECISYVRVLDTDGKVAQKSIEVRTSANAKPEKVVSLEVKGATTATVVISCATNFVNYHDISGDAKAKALKYLTDFEAKNKTFPQAELDHFKLYQSQFNRVSLYLGYNEKQSKKDVVTRIRDFRETSDPSLAAMYFQFGRYLLISSSQPGTQPANLQGVWNSDAGQYPSHRAGYATNGGVEMNYWPAEVCALGESNQPFLQMIKELSETGKTTAKSMYGARGWMLHNGTDLWRSTGAVGDVTSAMWPTANAWLCKHIWDHYLFTGDKQWLKDNYPIMREAAAFYEDFLYLDPATGYLVAGPSVSPDNQPNISTFINDKGVKENCAVFQGVTMDNEMIYDLLKNTVAAAKTLLVDADRIVLWDSLRAKLPPMKVDRKGQLQEWMQEVEEHTSNTNSLSHLWGAYPGAQMSPFETDTLFQAVKRSLTTHLDATSGGSMGWKVCLWARLLDGNHALRVLRNQLALKNANAKANDQEGGTYPNMFNAHPQFHVDDNMGCTAGVAEMLVQSHAGYIHLLPALPDDWKMEGQVKGLRARGGFEIVDMTWKYGRLESLVIRSKLGGNLRLRTTTPIKLQDALGLKLATDENPNPLMKAYEMPAPQVKDPSKIQAVEPKDAFIYDLDTRPNKLYVFKASM